MKPIKSNTRLLRCAVRTCTNTNFLQNDNEDVKFFSFPRARIEQWGEVLQIPVEKINSSLRVCSEHFLKEDFEPDISGEFFQMPSRTRLTPDAVPSLLLPPPPLEESPLSVLKSETQEISAVTLDMDTSSLLGETEEIISTPFLSHSSPSKSKVLEPCIICGESNFELDTSDLYFFPGAGDSTVLNQQMWSTYILRRILDLPAWKYAEILKISGAGIHPYQWFTVCKACCETVRIIADTEIAMKVLQQKVESMLRLVKSKLDKSFTLEARRNKRKDRSDFFVIRTEIRNSIIKGKSKNNGDSRFRETETLPLPLVEPKQEVEYNISTEFERIIPELPESPSVPLLDDEDEMPCAAEYDNSIEHPKLTRLRKRKAPLHDPLYIADGTETGSEIELPAEPDESDNDFKEQQQRKTRKRKLTKYKTKSKCKSKPRPKKSKNETSEDTFQCNLCPRKYIIETYLENHLNDHKKSQKLFGGKRDCIICKVPYHKVASLRLHYRTEHSQKLHTAWDGTSPQEDYLYTQETRGIVFQRLKEKGVDLNKNPAIELDSEAGVEYACTICPRKFARGNDMSNHLTRHKTSQRLFNGRFDCCKCKVPFRSPVPLRTHLRTEHNLMLSRTWNGTSSQEHHLRVILPKIQPTGKEGFKETFVLPNAEGRDVTYALESPDEPVPSDSNSTQSTKRKKSVKGKSIDKRSKPCPSNSEDIQDSQKLICEKCGFDAKTPGNLKSHIFNHKIFDNSVNPEISETEFVCNVCMQTFPTRRVLSSHKVQTHAEALGIEVYKCQECTQVFTRKSGWMQHVMSVHLKKGKFTCEHCGYASMSRCGIQKHMLRHTEKNQYMCEYCSATYSHGPAMNSHMQRYHPDKYKVSSMNFFKGVNVEKLNIEKSYAQNTVISKARLMKEKEVKCKYCAEVLPHNLAFKLHLKSVHQDMYQHSCNKCDKVYLSVASLQLHEKINHGKEKKSARCGWCFKTVASRLYLYSHMKCCKRKPHGSDVPKILVADEMSTATTDISSSN